MAFSWKFILCTALLAAVATAQSPSPPDFVIDDGAMLVAQSPSPAEGDIVIDGGAVIVDDTADYSPSGDYSPYEDYEISEEVEGGAAAGTGGAKPSNTTEPGENHGHTNATTEALSPEAAPSAGFHVSANKIYATIVAVTIAALV